MIVADVHSEGVLGAGDARAVRALILHAEVGVSAVHMAVETAPVPDQLPTGPGAQFNTL